MFYRVYIYIYIVEWIRPGYTTFNPSSLFSVARCQREVNVVHIQSPRDIFGIEWCRTEAEENLIFVFRNAETISFSSGIFLGKFPSGVSHVPPRPVGNDAADAGPEGSSVQRKVVHCERPVPRL